MCDKTKLNFIPYFLLHLKIFRNENDVDVKEVEIKEERPFRRRRPIFSQ